MFDSTGNKINYGDSILIEYVNMPGKYMGKVQNITIENGRKGKIAGIHLLHDGVTEEYDVAVTNDLIPYHRNARVLNVSSISTPPRRGRTPSPSRSRSRSRSKSTNPAMSRSKSRSRSKTKSKTRSKKTRSR